MSRSFHGTQKADAQRNHQNRRAEDSFQWEQIRAGFVAEPDRHEVKLPRRKAA